MVKKSKLILISARPNTWFRVWGEMIVAAALATTVSFNWGRFIIGFFAISPLLWSAAYILNDLTDIPLDKQHPYRKSRPIAARQFSLESTFVLILSLILLAFFFGSFINQYFIIILLLLFFGQILYTLSPFRFKEKFILDITSNGINSTLRFFAGWLTQQATLSAVPLSPLLFMVSLKLLFFLGHRRQNRLLEVKNKIKSTITILSLKQLNILMVAGFMLALFLFLLSIRQGFFPYSSLYLSLLILPFLPYIYLSLRQGKLFRQEKNLSFRTILYLFYFLFMNLIAYLILS